MIRRLICFLRGHRPGSVTMIAIKPRKWPFTVAELREGAIAQRQCLRCGEWV